MSTMQRVRQAISQSHDTIEQTDFAKSLMDGRITRAAYGVYLAQIHEIHAALERSIVATSEVAGYFQPTMIRTPAISRDAIALGQDLAVIPTLPETHMIVQQMEGWAASTPYALLGSLYILEGSRMGSMMIGRVLMKNLGLAPTTAIQNDRESRDTPVVPGVEYHLEDAVHTPRRVKELKAAIDAAGLSDQHEQELTLGACIFMQLLLDLYRILPVTLASPTTGPMRCPIHGGINAASSFAHPQNLRSA